MAAFFGGRRGQVAREAVERAYQYTGPEVHGKEKKYKNMIKEMYLGEQLAKEKLETSLRENWQLGQFSNKQDRIW